MLLKTYNFIVFHTRGLASVLVVGTGLAVIPAITLVLVVLLLIALCKIQRFIHTSRCKGKIKSIVYHPMQEFHQSKCYKCYVFITNKTPL